MVFDIRSLALNLEQCSSVILLSRAKRVTLLSRAKRVTLYQTPFISNVYGLTAFTVNLMLVRSGFSRNGAAGLRGRGGKGKTSRLIFG